MSDFDPNAEVCVEKLVGRKGCLHIYLYKHNEIRYLRHYQVYNLRLRVDPKLVFEVIDAQG